MTYILALDVFCLNRLTLATLMELVCGATAHHFHVVHSNFSSGKANAGLKCEARKGRWKLISSVDYSYASREYLDIYQLYIRIPQVGPSFYGGDILGLTTNTL